MSGIALPDGLAQDINSQQKREAMLKGLRVQFAGDVFSQLVAVSYQASLATGIHKKQHEAEVYGRGDDDDQQENGGIQSSIDLIQPATIAVRAADNLLLFLGMITPQMVQQGAEQQDKMIETITGQKPPARETRRGKSS